MWPIIIHARSDFKEGKTTPETENEWVSFIIFKWNVVFCSKQITGCQTMIAFTSRKKIFRI